MKLAQRWLPQYVRGRLKGRLTTRPLHVLFCLVDHFEPEWGGADLATQLARVERWATEYPSLARRHRDADGMPPRPTFFYPAEAYHPDVVETLAQLCRDGFGEVAIHLHHDGDTSEALARKLEQAKVHLSRHGLLARERATGRVRFGFIHGDWALDNSGPDGRYCGVNDELQVLSRTGCYADFTFPSAPSPTQPRKINSIYYATDDPHRPKSHDTGEDVVVGGQANGSLLMIQGPLTLNWARRKYAILPRIENGSLSQDNPPSPQRVDLWVRERIGVRGKPDWIIVKVYTHGAKSSNAAVLLGPAMDETLTYLETAYNDGAAFRLHYVTARELYNLIKAAERNEPGSPGQYRDYELLRACGELRGA